MVSEEEFGDLAEEWETLIRFADSFLGFPDGGGPECMEQ